MTTASITPDSKLVTLADMEARLQSIYRQRAAECDRPACDRKGVSTPTLQAKQAARLNKFDARATALIARIKTAKAA